MRIRVTRDYTYKGRLRTGAPWMIDLKAGTEVTVTRYVGGAAIRAGAAVEVSDGKTKSQP